MSGAVESTAAERIEELTRTFMAEGMNRRNARYRAKRIFEVESGAPPPLAWIGGIGVALATWGLFPLGVWIWEQVVECPGHARYVFRNVGRFFAAIAFAFFIFGLAVSASDGNTGGVVASLVILALIALLVLWDLKPRSR